MWDSGLGARIEKGHYWEIWEDLNKSCHLVNIIVPRSVLSCDSHPVVSKGVHIREN